MRRLIEEAIVLAVGAAAWSAAYVVVGGASALVEGFTTVARLRQLIERVNELEGRLEVVYAEHQTAVDTELSEILGEG